MKLTFNGGAKVVTGANYLLESGDCKILIDCGLHQGGSFCEKHNFEPFVYNPKEIRAVFVTHAHIDHTGLLPKLIKEGFKGKIYSTAPTKDFAELLLIDSEHILVEEAQRLKKPVIYTTRDIEDLMTRWEGINYHETVTVGPFKITLYNAGHILGSSFIEIVVENKKIIFSGDLGNSPAPIIGARENPPEDVDYCLMESTYGGRVHEAMDKRKGVLEDVIEDTINAGGNLMIPAFAMERTQDFLFELNDLVEHGRIPKAPIFLDSPLAIKLTAVYKKYHDYFNETAKKLIKSGDAIFNFPGLKMTLTTQESKSINEVKPPKIIIAGSGMSTAGRILHHERRYLPDPKSTLLIIGYQSYGSLGRKILDGDKKVKILGEEVVVRAKIASVTGYSAHADQPQLLEWLRPMRQSLKKIFLIQGEESQMEALALKVKDQYAINIEAPEPAYSVDL
ncbi:MAG: MBL fold metallo-hydrolase [bacterium]|nr:MBL fold metallo-hydrolase [bacterium]